LRGLLPHAREPAPLDALTRAPSNVAIQQPAQRAAEQAGSGGRESWDIQVAGEVDVVFLAQLKLIARFGVHGAEID
jgi:hypothetical protein